MPTLPPVDPTPARPLTRRQQLTLAEDTLQRATAKLRAHEAIWQIEWDAIVCPFTRWQNYRTEAQRARRRLVIAPWLAAQGALEALRGGQAPTR